MNSIIRYTVTFLLLIALQLLIFNNIEFSGYVNPYVYVMFILILPVAMPSWILLLLGFLTGFVIDLFSGTMGVDTFATVIAAYVRPWVLSLNVTAETAEGEKSHHTGAASDGSWFTPPRWCWLITWPSFLLRHSASGYSCKRCCGFC